MFEEAVQLSFLTDVMEREADNRLDSNKVHSPGVQCKIRGLLNKQTRE